MSSLQIDRTTHLITDITELACGKNFWKSNSDGSGVWKSHNLKYVDCPKCLSICLRCRNPRNRHWFFCPWLETPIKESK